LPNYQKEYQALPKEIQDNFDKKLSLFLENLFHPSIRTKWIQGAKKDASGLSP
jgi:mRNA-degrading endonuclease RelE of RelBE toxin-antitoxin system